LSVIKSHFSVPFRFHRTFLIVQNVKYFGIFWMKLSKFCATRISPENSSEKKSRNLLLAAFHAGLVFNDYLCVITKAWKASVMCANFMMKFFLANLFISFSLSFAVQKNLKFKNYSRVVRAVQLLSLQLLLLPLLTITIRMYLVITHIVNHRVLS
jgi:hypothetical protein